MQNLKQTAFRYLLIALMALAWEIVARLNLVDTTALPPLSNVAAAWLRVVVIDPVDGSTNASRGIPWFATSLCALDAEGPRASLVVNQASGERFEAVRGGGARKDGEPIGPSGCDRLDRAIVGFSGYPARYLGWSQYRCLGAAALDLCAVAEGVLDGYAVIGGSKLGSWDYLGGMLVCTEAGAVLAEAAGRDLVTLSHTERRAPFAAATPALLEAFLAAAGQ